MRRAHEYQLIFTDGTKLYMHKPNEVPVDETKFQFVGIDLGADFTSEHEWGIKRIKQSLGMSTEGATKEINGLSLRKISKINLDTLLFHESENGNAVLIYEDYIYQPIVYKERILQEMKKKNASLCGSELGLNTFNPNIATAWDESSFGIITTNLYAKYLKELYKSFVNIDIALFMGMRQCIENRGLCISIASRIPQSIQDIMKFDDLSGIRLHEEAHATGIFKELENANMGPYKGYFALSPKWKDRESKDDIIYWLNPYDQQNNNFGWYTVEQLRQWIKGEGPIPKKNNPER